eukprot:1990047-Karenia_brevis.AAC.1
MLLTKQDPALKSRMIMLLVFIWAHVEQRHVSNSDLMGLGSVDWVKMGWRAHAIPSHEDKSHHRPSNPCAGTA